MQKTTELNKLCKTEGTQFFFTTKNEKKTVFAESTKRFLKNIVYRHLEDYG